LRTLAAEGGCPQDFVDDFSAFLHELKRYFNRSGVLDQLYAMRGELGPDLVMIIDELRDAMGALAMAAVGDGEGGGLTGLEGASVVRALRAATALRGHFTSQLSATARGMRNDAGLVDEPAVQRQQAYRLVEISLEELAFVLLTRALFCAGVSMAGRPQQSHNHSSMHAET
jgi:phosphoglucan,water dikinase